MRSRWLHKPELHTSRSGASKRASWLELFYDLVFVAAFIQLGNVLSYDLSFGSVALFAIVFSALWFSWTGFTFYSNRFNVDDFVHRFLVFLQMLGVAGMAAFAPRSLSENTTMFSLSVAGSQLIVAILYLRSWRQSTDGRGFSRYWGSVFFFGAVVWGISAAVEAPWTFLFWGIGLLAYVGAPFSSHSINLATSSPYDTEHLSERYGILTIIVLGEAFVKVISTLGSNNAQANLFGQSAYTLLIAFCIWWIYFDDIVHSEVKERKFSFNFWLYGHIPLHGAIVALGVAIQKAATFDLGEPAKPAYRYLLCFSLGIAFLAVALLDAFTERKHSELNDRVRVNVRIGSGLLILLLAPAGRGMDAGLLLAILGLVCGAQVIFDTMMTPLEETKHDKPVTSTADHARQRLSGATLPRLRVGSAIRKGTPDEFRRDLYFFFIEGSWKRFFVSVIVGFFLINVLFAGLYMIEPSSIANARIDSFADAFYFSVQTIATIGYGALHPGNDYGNIIAVIEATVGLAVIALTTGLMFAKASKPRASIIFSKPMVINTIAGKPHLMFRAGNTRGSEIVSAEISVAVLRDEFSPEGQHIRRMHDVKLVRHRSPFFSLTWLVLHEIDAQSPFRDLVEKNVLDPSVISVVCILTGHDSTYGQTIHARHLYYPEDIVNHANFVDVIGQMDDGRMVVDYAKFNDVKLINSTS